MIHGIQSKDVNDAWQYAEEFLEWREEVDELLHRFGRKGWGNYLKDINYNEQVRMFSKEIV
jgi:hypothetical protein